MFRFIVNERYFRFFMKLLYNEEHRQDELRKLTGMTRANLNIAIQQFEAEYLIYKRTEDNRRDIYLTMKGQRFAKKLEELNIINNQKT